MTDKIPQTTKDLWLPLLEGEGEALPQARKALYDDRTGGYCCLGVYAKASGATFYREDERDDVIVSILGQGDVNESELLQQEWANTQGISADAQELLSNLNDGGEHTISRDNPLIAVWRKHATAENPAANPARITFSMPQYDFAQIAKVIREDL